MNTGLTPCARPRRLPVKRAGGGGFLAASQKQSKKPSPAIPGPQSGPGMAGLGA